MPYDERDDEYLEHYGVKGMKWRNHKYVTPDTVGRVLRGNKPGEDQGRRRPVSRTTRAYNTARAYANRAGRAAKAYGGYAKTKAGKITSAVKGTHNKGRALARHPSIAAKPLAAALKKKGTRAAGRSYLKARRTLSNVKGRAARIKTNASIAGKAYGGAAKKKATRAYNTAKTYGARAERAAKAYGGAAKKKGARAYNTAKTYGGKAERAAKAYGSKAYRTARTYGGKAYGTAKNYGGKAYGTARTYAGKIKRKLS